MERKVLMYMYDKDFDITKIDIKDFNEDDKDSFRSSIERVIVKKYEDIQEDIVRRSTKYYYKTYFIINKKGYARVQNRIDTFSRHYLLKNGEDIVNELTKLFIETAEPLRKIDLHMKFNHREYNSDCDIRE